jgi:cysteine-rich repeat protein
MPAGSASDVCASDANPCVVDDAWTVAPNATLDFGFREVQIVDGGRFDFGYDGGNILCGSFRATTEGTALDAFPSESSFGFTFPSFVTIQARKSCSGASPAYPCFLDGNCSLGPCDTRYCENSQTQACLSDVDCQLGTCSETTRRCSGGFAFCQTNADCNLGSCPVELSCRDSYDGKYACSTDEDCELGTCSVGEGTIEIASRIDGRRADPGEVYLVAAGAVAVTGPIYQSSRHRESDGGAVYIDSYGGDLRVAGKVQSRGGRYAMGGDVELHSSGDVVLEGDVNVQGGDFDGGILWVTADGSIDVQGDVLADSRRGAGYGGLIVLDALGDISIGPGPDSADQKISLNGHHGAEGFGGDGGELGIEADGNATVAEGVTIRANGARRGGYGGLAWLEAGGDVAFHGKVEALGPGHEMSGGAVELIADGELVLGEMAELDVSGVGRSGDVFIASGGDAVLAGTTTSEGHSSNRGGELVVESGGDVLLSGTALLSGGEGTTIELDACRIRLAAGAALVNESAVGINRLVARESMTLEAGSSIVVQGGLNELVHRAAQKPPVIAGTVEPSPSIVVNAALVGCPKCGNSEIDQTESCDDGNASGGDGCSEMCLIE